MTKIVEWIRYDWDPRVGSLEDRIRNIVLYPVYWYVRTEDFFYGIYYGIKNIVEWLPIIWHDSDFDFAFFAKINEFKMRRMSAYFRDHGVHIGSDKDARDLAVCAELFRRIGGDTDSERAIARSKFFGCSKTGFIRSEAEYPKMIARIIGRRMYHWW